MPIHNEADTIERGVLDFYETISRRMPVEIVLSEDGSGDGTRDVIMRLAKRIPLKATLSPMRKGYAGGIKSGLELVGAKYVLVTDSDGQLGAGDFWKLWDLREKCDIVSGWRIKRADSAQRKIMSNVFQKMNKTLLKLPRFRDVSARLNCLPNFRTHRSGFYNSFLFNREGLLCLLGMCLGEIHVTPAFEERGLERMREKGEAEW